MHTLIFMLASLGAVQCAVASQAVTLVTQDLHHGGAVDHASHGHDHSHGGVDSTAEEDCLDACLEMAPKHFVVAATASVPEPELVPINKIKSGSQWPTVDLVSTFSTHLARGPPGPFIVQRKSVLRGLLLLNARLRN